MLLTVKEQEAVELIKQHLPHITFRKDDWNSAAFTQGWLRMLMKVSHVLRKMCTTRNCHYYRFYLPIWRIIATSSGLVQVFPDASADKLPYKESAN